MTTKAPTAARFIDTHAHLESEQFDGRQNLMIQTALDAGVQKIIAIGCTWGSSQKSLYLAKQHENVFAAVGIHPNYCSTATDHDWERILAMLEHPKVVALGETGLDRYWDYAPIDLQREYFLRHLELSRKIEKPFVVHCRDADDEVRDVLRNAAQGGPLNGVMHSFCQSAQSAQEYLSMGLHLSFTGMLTFRKNDALRQTAASLPIERIFVETDAPYLAPMPNRGKRNEPAFVRFTLNCLAKAHGMEPEEMAELTTSNARRFFGF